MMSQKFYWAERKYPHLDTYSIALSAYNAGGGAVEDAKGVPNFDETKDYIANCKSEIHRQ